MQHDHILINLILFSYGGGGGGVAPGAEFETNSYLELWRPFCSAEWNHLCDFVKGHYQKQFCEIILNLDQWFKRKFH